MEKTYKQSVVLHNYPFGLYIKLYRGGFDRENKKGMDPCFRSSDPVNDIVSGRIPKEYPIERGITLAAMDKYSNDISRKQFIKVGKFFFGEDFDGKMANLKKDEFITVDEELMLVFSYCNDLVLYRIENNNFIPKKVTKECTKYSKFYKTWNNLYRFYENGKGKYAVKGYDFGKVDFILAPPPSHYRNFLPEYGKTVEMKSITEPWDDYADRIYKLPPIDLGKSWDYTEEEKSKFKEEADKIIQKRKEEERKLEERKHTPGYCEMCGEPADYVIDPYAADIYNITRYRWLCPSCLTSTAGDI